MSDNIFEPNKNDLVATNQPLETTSVPIPDAANRSYLIQKMTGRLDYLTLEDSKYAVSALFNYMSKTLSQNKRIELRGFGTFSIRKHSAKKTCNLRTAKDVIVPSRYSPHFKPGTLLKNRVNDSKDKIPLKTL